MAFDPKNTSSTISEDQKVLYAGFWVLKKLDLSPKDGGMSLEVPLPIEHSACEPVLDRLVIDRLLDIDEKKHCYKISQAGIDHVGQLIDEIEEIIEEFDDEEAHDMYNELKKRNIDPFRIRFLWGWYQGEFDQPVLFQQRRGFTSLSHEWADFISSDAFYANLQLDLP